MPRIRTIEPQIGQEAGVPGRRAQGADFGGAGLSIAGAGLQQTGDTLYNVAQQQEISDVQAKLAQARAQATLDLETRSSEADPADPAFASKFTEEFSTSLSKLGENLQTRGGQAAFQRGAAELSAGVLQAAGLEQARMAGAKAKSDYLATVDANRNTLLNDPTQFDTILRETDAALGDPNGPYARLSAAAKAELARETRADLALSAAQGIIRAAPELGLQLLKDGRFDKYIDADKKNSLIDSAEMGIRGQQVEAERIERARERAEEKAREATKNDFIARVFPPDGQPSALSVRDVLNSNLEAAEKEHFIKLIDTEAKGGTITTDSAVFIDLWDRVHLPDGDPNKIVDEREIEKRFGRGLTAENVKLLRAEMQGRQTEEGSIESDLRKGLIATAKTAITGTNSFLRIRDPKGDVQYQRFMSWFLPEYQRQRQAGKSAVELLDPDSKDYLGNAIARFARTPTEFMRDLMNYNPGVDVGIDTPAEPPAEGSKTAVSVGIPAADDIPSQATKQATSGQETIYLVDGKWVRADGSEVK